MNPFFAVEGREAKLPSRLYARLDQTEPVVPLDGDETVFAYDTVDADWPGFRAGGVLDLNLPRVLYDRWQRNLHEPPANDAFDEVPLFRLELTLPKGELSRRLDLLGDGWLEFELDSRQGIAADIFSGLFSPPVATFVARPPHESPQHAALEAVFGMMDFPDATQSEIEATLHGASSYHSLAMYDVGQGSASAVLDTQDEIAFYFDVGCGVYRNARTCPPVPLRFCHKNDVPVILSHWDSDHWAAATQCPALLNLPWIVPRQKMGPKHRAFAARIRNLLVVPTGPSRYIAHSASGERLTVARASGPPSDRNSSGLVAIVENLTIGQAWLLTGDAGYSYIPGLSNYDFAAIVVPHHGADMGLASLPPAKPTSVAYPRAMYSFGPGNRHGKTRVSHPTARAVHAHIQAGWIHGAWPANAPGSCIAGGDVLATAANPSTHLDGAICGWNTKPPVPVHPCHSCNATVTIKQA